MENTDNLFHRMYNNARFQALVKPIARVSALVSILGSLALHNTGCATYNYDKLQKEYNTPEFRSAYDQLEHDKRTLQRGGGDTLGSGL